MIVKRKWRAEASTIGKLKNQAAQVNEWLKKTHFDHRLSVLGLLLYCICRPSFGTRASPVANYTRIAMWSERYRFILVGRVVIPLYSDITTSWWARFSSIDLGDRHNTLTQVQTGSYFWRKIFFSKVKDSTLTWIRLTLIGSEPLSSWGSTNMNAWQAMIYVYIWIYSSLPGLNFDLILIYLCFQCINRRLLVLLWWLLCNGSWVFESCGSNMMNLRCRLLIFELFL